MGCGAGFCAIINVEVMNKDGSEMDGGKTEIGVDIETKMKMEMEMEI